MEDVSGMMFQVAWYVLQFKIFVVVYVSDDGSGTTRSWPWPQPVASLASGDGGMVMYQMPSERSADVQQQRQNGLPLSSPPEYRAAKSQHQLSGTDQPASSARVEQLEAEVQRLRSALAEKTVEAQNLQHELQTALQLIEKHELSQQRQDNSQSMAETTAPADTESLETSTAVTSQD